MATATSAAMRVGGRLLATPAVSTGGFDFLTSRDDVPSSMLSLDVDAFHAHGYGIELGRPRREMTNKMTTTGTATTGPWSRCLWGRESDGKERLLDLSMSVWGKKEMRQTGIRSRTRLAIGGRSMRQGMLQEWATPSSRRSHSVAVAGLAEGKRGEEGDVVIHPSTSSSASSGPEMNTAFASADAVPLQSVSYGGPVSQAHKRRRRAPPKNEEERQQFLEERKAELVEEIHRTHDEHVLIDSINKELKLGKWLMNEQQYAKALSHFETAMCKCEFKTGEHGEAAIAKATCLEKLGRLDEAKVLYQILTAHPFPVVKRKARQFLYGSPDMPGGSNLMDNPFYKLYMQSYSNYVVPESERREETPREKLLLQLIPISLLLMGPLLALGLLLHAKQ